MYFALERKRVRLSVRYRDIALKVLNAQCRKVQTDEEAKATVIKSFYKLFNGKFAVRFKDLTEEQQAKILRQLCTRKVF